MNKPINGSQSLLWIFFNHFSTEVKLIYFPLLHTCFIRGFKISMNYKLKWNEVHSPKYHFLNYRCEDVMLKFCKNTKLRKKYSSLIYCQMFVAWNFLLILCKVFSYALEVHLFFFSWPPSFQYKFVHGRYSTNNLHKIKQIWSIAFNLSVGKMLGVLFNLDLLYFSLICLTWCAVSWHMP